MIALLLLIIFTNAIVSGAEAAFFSFKEEETDDIFTSVNPNDIQITALLNKPERLLASIIIAYNFLNVVILALSLYLLHKIPFFARGTAEKNILSVALAILLVLILIEAIPKLYASGDHRKFARKYVHFIRIISKIISPFSSLLVNSSNIISRSTIQRKYEISMDELSKALEITSNEITHEQEKDMLEGIIRFKDTTVDDILISRSDVFALDLSTPFDKVIDYIVEAGFSRIPVYDEDLDNIKGILYVKDLLPHLNRQDDFQWQSLVRQAYFVPGTKRIDDLLEEFRTNKKHMAVVVDEYGGTNGIVTMEDILEEIVGDISDEYDEDKPLYSLAADGSYIFEGKTPLEDFFRITGVSESAFRKYTAEADTVAGLMLELKGNFPKRKETIVFDEYKLQAEEMTKRRIVKVRYTPPPQKKNAKAAE
ncbi:MAG: gliding motility-associated protein GldE [Petrimonas sp.]|nr:gliding motility-associated protein GldE [Petrimonas sp.]